MIGHITHCTLYVCPFICLVVAYNSKMTRAHQEMTYPNVTWHISHLFTYLPLNYDTPESTFWVTRTGYISSGRWFTKSALRILLYYPPSVFLAYTSLLSVVCRFIQEAQLTQKDREHTVSWNRVKCCTNVRRITFEEASNLQMTFKVIQGHCRCCHLIGHTRLPISLPS